MATPMMEQYFKIKEKYKDVLLFYRLGDFYEMFGNDAIVASKELDITLTKRSNGESTMPMCGVPYHSVETYIQKLLSKNFKVALCNQMTQPEKGKLVERSVVRIITRGTVIEDTFLLSDCNNFLLSVFFQNYLFAAAWTDISTGEINFQILDSFVSLNELLSRLSPSEIISNMEMANKSPMISMVKYGECCPFTALDDKFFDYEFAQKNISEQFGSDFFGKLQGNKECICAMGGLLSYIEYTHKKKLKHLSLKGSDKSHFMSIDHNARRTLELFINTVDGKKRNSLLSVLDRTCTGMGSRNIRKWLERPLLSKQKIDERLQGVEEIFLDKEQNADRLNELLCEIKDVERICGRISCELATPADILSLGQTLSIVPKVKNVLNNFNSDIIIKINKSLFDKSKLYSLILSAIKPDHSATIRDGGVIRYGFDKKLDELCSSHDNAEQLIRDLQTNERESTGIKNLKISKNSVFGYFIEVSNSFLNQVPYRYIRKQTVASGERFFTEELKEIEERILSSKEKSIERECEIYKELLSQIYNEIDDVFIIASALADIDCLLSFAVSSRINNYKKPTISEESRIEIKEGRHPVVEKSVRNEVFSPNDTLLDDSENKIMLITGPNMAGKSVYMRQVALIVIMAHIGCFVPAESAIIGLVDKVFTRVGASDDISTGRSTFMVEMSEVASIMQGATDKSLILLDEVGRGTSTYDGLSIAWAVIEFLAKKLKSKVLFSTHYLELTDLEKLFSCIKNYKLSASESQKSIVFLRKLTRGSADRSFGIEVAALAGLSHEVVSRAKEILCIMQNKNSEIQIDHIINSEEYNKENSVDFKNYSAYASNDYNIDFNVKAFNDLVLKDNQYYMGLIDFINSFDVDDITPRRALDILCEIKDLASNID